MEEFINVPTKPNYSNWGQVEQLGHLHIAGNGYFMIVSEVDTMQIYEMDASVT